MNTDQKCENIRQGFEVNGGARSSSDSKNLLGVPTTAKKFKSVTLCGGWVEVHAGFQKLSETLPVYIVINAYN